MHAVFLSDWSNSGLSRLRAGAEKLGRGFSFSARRHPAAALKLSAIMDIWGANSTSSPLSSTLAIILPPRLYLRNPLTSY
jgi:hypothetical protein